MVTKIITIDMSGSDLDLIGLSDGGRPELRSCVLIRYLDFSATRTLVRKRDVSSNFRFRTRVRVALQYVYTDRNKSRHKLLPTLSFECKNTKET